VAFAALVTADALASGDNAAVHNLTNADLHCHSRFSDGTLSPTELARRAHANGVTLWSLTDHDELAGLAEAGIAARELGLPFLPGVEVSVTFAGETVHIVGLGIDASNAALRDGLAHTRDGRQLRSQAMSDSLAHAGLPGALKGALRYVTNPELVSRTHFARWLVDTGVCIDMGSVFRRYLTDGKPGYVPHQWARLGDAVRWITQANGIAVIAHPARYKLSVIAEYALFSEFKAHGGQAVEVLTSSHGQADQLKYAGMAQEFGLLASRGSDFHAPGESRLDLGQLPDLPGQLQPVWLALADRVQ
jgi:3',5'-nucleoside bisphosphate phosphatase